jgi:predicted DCC family thiol-disulfide oxidoreductase YuxK
VLLFDGVCALCAESVRLVLRHDRAGTLRFATLRGGFGAGIRAGHPELEGVDSLVWVEPGSGGSRETVLTRSEAALRIARYLGGWWHLVRVVRAVPRPVRDAAYDLLARHRHRLSTGKPSCLVPTLEAGSRFLG